MLEKIEFRFLSLLLSVFVCVTMTGCLGLSTSERPERSPDERDERLQVGDTVIARFSGAGSQNLDDHQENIKNDGTITLANIGRIIAVGKTPIALQSEIQSEISKFYRNVSVIVEAVRYFYVSGDVISPGKFAYSSDMTVTRAITTAGDFNNFARKSGVLVTGVNGGEPILVNVRKAINDPSYDMVVFPGDQIHVPRRIGFE